MKTKLFYLLLFLCGLSSLGISQNQETFYYTLNEEKTYISPIPNKYLVEFEKEPSENELAILKQVLIQKLYNNIYLIDNTKVLKGFQTPFYTNPAYQTRDKLELYITEEISLQFKPEIPDDTRKAILEEFGLQPIKQPNSYELYRAKNALAISNRLYEQKVFEFCYPNFISAVEKFHIPNDEYFPQQFYLHNTGQALNDGHTGTVDADIDAPEAWDISKGSSALVVAVIDEGVTSNHPDLPNTRQVRLAGSNFSAAYDGTSVNNPSPTGNGNHGNACAGIIAAEQDNNEGVTGIAPHTTIMPVRIPFGYIPGSVYADAIEFATNNGASIISNSWGYNTSDQNYVPAVVSAIQYAINADAVVVFSAGNTAHQAGGNTGYTGFPGNANVNGLITVGSSNRDNMQANYSPTSDLVELTAPSHHAYNSQIAGESFEIWTIDIPGTAGYNEWHESWAGLPAVGEELPSSGTNYLSYTGRMGGTSAAAPEVAGVAALVRSINPCLTNMEVKELLEATADKVGGYNYNWSASKPGHSKQLGYGKVNAYQAALAAQQAFDLYIKDKPADTGIEPNPSTASMWRSEDIWVRVNNDGGSTHQNPEYKGNINPNYVNVKVRNRGCLPVSGASLKVYFSKASTGLSWPTHWDNYYQTTSSGSVLHGDEITSTPIALPTLPPGAVWVVQVPWIVPDPGKFDIDVHHFCLLARIESADDPMTFPETSNVNQNTRNNNNIAWKNVSVYDLNPNNPSITAGVYVRNLLKKKIYTSLKINVPEEHKKVFDYFLRRGKMIVKLDKKLMKYWQAGGAKGKGVERLNDNELIIFSADASLENVILPALETGAIQFQLSLEDFDAFANIKGFSFDLVQIDQRRKEVVGGERFDVRISTKEEHRFGNARASTKMDAANLPTNTSVVLKNNPTSDWTGLEYTLDKDTKVSIELFNTTGQLVKTIVSPNIQSSGIQKVDFNASNLPKGLYIYKIALGEELIMKKLIVQ